MWPFSTKAAAVEETKAESDLITPESWLVTHFGGSADDLSMTAQIALQVPAVASAVRLISESAATLEVKVQKKVKGTWQDVPNHPAAKLLNGEANEWTSAFEMTRALMVETLTNDPGGFAIVTWSTDKRPIAITKYKPGMIQAEFAADGSGRPLYKKNGAALQTSNIVHVRNAFNLAPITHARDAIQYARSLQLYGRNLFQNGARPGGLLKVKKPIGDKGIEAMLRGFAQAFSGSHNAGKTPVLWDDTEYVQLGLSSTDAQYLENRRFQNEEIARAFRVPPTMIFDLERGTWGNAEQMGREFLTYCLEPWLRELEGAYGRALLTEDERRNHRILFDRDDLTRADLVSRATAISSFMQTKAINANEARAWIDLPPREGGDVYENPAITVPVQAPTAEQKPAAPKTKRSKSLVSLKREYNGEEKIFTVADPLLFEALTPPRSTYAYLQKFTAGMWSTADVALVLSFAIHGPTGSLAQHWRFAKNMARFGSMSSAYDHLTYTPHPDVLAVVSKAPGDYAPLAIDILTELVFGDGASKGDDDE